METVNRSVIAKRYLGGKGMNWWSTEDLQGIETIIYDIIMMDTCYGFVQTHRMYNTKSEM